MNFGEEREHERVPLRHGLGHVLISGPGAFAGVQLNPARVEGVDADFLTKEIVEKVNQAGDEADERRRKHLESIGIF